MSAGHPHDFPPNLSEAVADALTRNVAMRVEVSGAGAANAFGLTTEVPGVPSTRSTARTRHVTRHVVWLRRAVPRTRTGAGTAADAIVSALRHLGPARLEAAVLARVPITDGPVS